jgi:hypothetical protein
LNRMSRAIALLLVLTNTPVLTLTAASQSGGAVKKRTARPEVGRAAPRVTPTAFANPELMKQYQQTILPTTLASHLYFLASDLFEGRETGTRGQKLAAQYLAAQYRLMGLAPKGTVKGADPLSSSAYFQPFTLYPQTPKQTRLEVSAGGVKVASSIFSAEAHDDLSYFLSGGAKDESGGVVFAGYGIADDGLGYNDYAALAAGGVSIDGKWVMILADEPLSDASTSLLPTADHKPSRWTTGFVDKPMALRKAGRPKGVLVVRDAGPRVAAPFSDAAAIASLNAKRVGTLSNYQASDAVQTYAVSTRLANQLLAPSGSTVETLRRQINQSLKPNVFEVKGVVVDSTVEQPKGSETENVLAFVEGSDPRLKDEVLVISAHYDHLGVNPLLKGDQIFNGAADDGSGTAATLEIARAFMNARRDGFGPRRSILFANFAAEEKGLLGSFHYTTHEPVIPLEKTVADINMDGAGGIDLKHPTGSKDYIYIAGAKNLSDELVALNRRVKAATGSSVELTDAPAGFGSDSDSFQSMLVPFIYYSTGFTEHYHRISDGPETVDYEHFARVARLVFATAWQVANQDGRPTSVDRSKLTIDGYVCRPCRLACDNEVFSHPGTCPICGMNLVPRYVVTK